MQFRFPAPRWLLPALLLTLPLATAEAKPAKIKDLADTIAANPILTKFSSMIAASDLGTFLSSRGPFTVFAPTDSAFSKLPPGTLETLLRPENKVRLQDILLCHVVNSRRLGAKDLVPLKAVLSCQGTILPVRTSHSGTQFVMKSKIVSADNKCANGIINQIDTVLMPPESALPPIAAPPPPAPATNAPAATPPDTNAPAADAATPPPADTNAIPVAPIAQPVR
jgi:uncharacterized surface protein with fasciclin (FAS1) repeats